MSCRLPHAPKSRLATAGVSTPRLAARGPARRLLRPVSSLALLSRALRRGPAPTDRPGVGLADPLPVHPQGALDGKLKDRVGRLEGPEWNGGVHCRTLGCVGHLECTPGDLELLVLGSKESMKNVSARGTKVIHLGCVRSCTDVEMGAAEDRADGREMRNAMRTHRCQEADRNPVWTNEGTSPRCTEFWGGHVELGPTCHVAPSLRPDVLVLTCATQRPPSTGSGRPYDARPRGATMHRRWAASGAAPCLAGTALAVA